MVFKIGERASRKTEFKRASIGHKWIRDDKWGKQVLVKIAHPNIYKSEHTIVAEKTYRKIKKNEIVHHIDWDGLNNAPSNLYITTRAHHAKLHKLDKLLKELILKNIVSFDREKGEYSVNV